MDNDEIVEYIFGGGNSSSPDFLYWFKSCGRFKLFAESYKDLIRSKIMAAQKGPGNCEEDLKDVLYELQEAYRLLRCDRFVNLEYEKFKTSGHRSPDFTVTLKADGVFNVEVKRIRESIPAVRLDAWTKSIQSHISTIRSNLALSIHISSAGEPDAWLARLEQETPRVIEYIQRIHVAHLSQDDIPSGQGGVPHYVPGFENQIELEFWKPPQKLTDSLDWYGGSFPVFSTQCEYRKFGDEITCSLGQMMPDMINVLVISTGSYAYGYRDFNEALKCLAQQIADRDDAFFIERRFVDANDFLSQSRKLSGVVFRSSWISQGSNTINETNWLWCNDDADEKSQLPLVLKDALQATIDQF